MTAGWGYGGKRAVGENGVDRKERSRSRDRSRRKIKLKDFLKQARQPKKSNDLHHRSERSSSSSKVAISKKKKRKKRKKKKKGRKRKKYKRKRSSSSSSPSRKRKHGKRKSGKSRTSRNRSRSRKRRNSSGASDSSSKRKEEARSSRRKHRSATKKCSDDDEDDKRSGHLSRNASSSAPANVGEARNALTYRDDGKRRFVDSDAENSDESVSDCSRSRTETEEEDESEYTSDCSESNLEQKVAAAIKAGAWGPTAPPKGRPQDDVPHFSWQKGTVIHERYEITKLLGDGTFGRVVLAEDNKKGRQVAIKVIRSVEKYTRNAKREAEILEDIRRADSKKAAGCVRMYETFTHHASEGRLFCMSFEVLGCSLYDLLLHNRFRGLWVQDVQSIARQCLEALNFLHTDLSLAHTDLKLENVLFTSVEDLVPAEFLREALWQEAHRSSKNNKPVQYKRPANTAIKLIDFGNATYELEHHSPIINTRQYRAPEVILSLGWDEHSDLWSVGCILMELYTGELLFRTHESLEHLALMERSVESLPKAMLSKVQKEKRERFLSRDVAIPSFELKWPEGATSDTSEKRVRNQRPLHQLVLPQHKPLADFVASLLILDPARRPSAAAALVHPFFFELFED